jgi:hypothetical protein
MNTYTTKEAAKLVCRELGKRARQLELTVIENESGTIQIEATCDEIADFERLGNPSIETDVISNELMSNLLEHLKFEVLLEPSLV